MILTLLSCAHGPTPAPADAGWARFHSAFEGSCVTDASGQAWCWRNDASEPTPIGPVVAGPVMVAGAGPCWQDGDLALRCEAWSEREVHPWGAEPGVLPPLTQMFASLSFVGGLAADGSIHLFSSPSWDGAAPGGPFVQATAGLYTDVVCGVPETGGARCSGRGAWTEAPATWPLEGSFIDVSIRDGFVCGVDASGESACGVVSVYTQEAEAQAKALEELPVPDAPLSRIEMAGLGVCGIRTDGQIQCWGELSEFDPAPPEGEFADLSCGLTACCALDARGALTCWGRDDHLAGAPPGIRVLGD